MEIKRRFEVLKKRIDKEKKYYEDIIRLKMDDKERLGKCTEEFKAGMKEQQEKLVTHKEELRHSASERTKVKKTLFTSQKELMEKSGKVEKSQETQSKVQKLQHEKEQVE